MLEDYLANLGNKIRNLSTKEIVVGASLITLMGIGGWGVYTVSEGAKEIKRREIEKVEYQRKREIEKLHQIKELEERVAEYTTKRGIRVTKDYESPWLVYINNITSDNPKLPPMFVMAQLYRHGDRDIPYLTSVQAVLDEKGSTEVIINLSGDPPPWPPWGKMEKVYHTVKIVDTRRLYSFKVFTKDNSNNYGRSYILDGLSEEKKEIAENFYIALLQKILNTYEVPVKQKTRTKQPLKTKRTTKKR